MPIKVEILYYLFRNECSLSFALEKCIRRYISNKKFYQFFYFDILTRLAKENILKVDILHLLVKGWILHTI